MVSIDHEYIKNQVAGSEAVFKRGENLFVLGNYSLVDEDRGADSYRYAFDGTYGVYDVHVRIKPDTLEGSCTCPYPRFGCKHYVAACLDISRRKKREQESGGGAVSDEYLTPEEIKEAALQARAERAKQEKLTLLPGETRKGRHTVKTAAGTEYILTIYDPEKKTGHCSCPDFATNHLDTCKHLLFAFNALPSADAETARPGDEAFPFIHLTYSSRLQKPVCYYESIDDDEIRNAVTSLFNDKGVYTRDSFKGLFSLYEKASDETDVLQFDEVLLDHMENALYRREVEKLEKRYHYDLSFLRTQLYPYQDEGVRFAVFKKSAVIADEMGLGKTLQAIAAALIKREVFGFSKILIICPSSLKQQWKQEIEKFSSESAVIVAGGRRRRNEIYDTAEAPFLITNYEAVLRDRLALERYRPDLVILDEAQRIKNFETKTHRAVNAVPRSHSLVLTGTPLENKLEDLYSIIQFADPGLLTPLWAFAANHFNLSKTKKNAVLGYKNLDTVYQKIKPLVIRRKKEDVFDSLPERIENTYWVDLSREQDDIHQGYLSIIVQLMNKKVQTPMDIKRLQKILTAMRMVCDSTYLIDKKTNVSPKLEELATILKEQVLDNRRKVIIFSEWTNMTFLIGKLLSNMGIDFVEFTGKVPVEKRTLLIEEFRDNPSCMVFLATDAAGVGLNLQNCDCLVNFELPWNPARLNQRIGRIHRIGQTSDKVNIINLVSKNSIEEKVYAGINLKQELFDAALEGKGDFVDMSRENREKFVNRVRALFTEEELEAEAPRSKAQGSELDEDTPHYLNPEVLDDRETIIDITGEEFGETDNEGDVENHHEEAEARTSPEDMETVLNQGLAFLSSLSAMATGKPLDETAQGKSVEIDRETGEVVLRFKLPGLN